MPRAAWAILVLALVVRIAAVAVVDFTPVSDPADYDRHARSIAAGDGYPESVYAPGGGTSALRPPLYPYALGAVYAVTGDSVTAGKLMAVGAGLLTVALIGIVALQLWGRRAALVTLAIAAVYLPLVLVNTTLISEALALPLMLGAVAAVLRFRDPPHRLRWALLAGALVGLGMLARPALVVLLVPLVFGLWLSPWQRLRGLAAPALAVAVAALAILPWTVRNAVELDAFVPVSTQDGYLLAGTYNDTARNDPDHPGLYVLASDVPALSELLATPGLGEAELSRRLGAEGRDYARENPRYIGTVVTQNSLRLLELGGGPDVGRISFEQMGLGKRAADAARVSFYALALLALAGLALGGARRPVAFFWVTPFLLFASVVLISGDVRYRLPIEPFVVLLAGYALAAAWERFRRRGAELGPARASA